MAIIERFEVEEIDYSLKYPFVTSLREVTSLRTVSVVINDRFRGDAVESAAITGDSYEVIKKELIYLQSKLIGLDTQDDFSDLPVTNSAKSAIDCACADANGALPPLTEVKTDVTIPIANLEELKDIVRLRLVDGFRAFKIKLHNENLTAIVDKLKLIKELASDTKLRLDPNQSWTPEFCILVLNELDKNRIPIDYIEQPVNRFDYAGLATIRKNVSIPVMADESCFSMDDLLQLLDHNSIDIVNLKY